MIGNTMGTFRVLLSANGGGYSGGYLGKAGPQGVGWNDAAIYFGSSTDAKVSSNIFLIDIIPGLYI